MPDANDRRSPASGKRATARPSMCEGSQGRGCGRPAQEGNTTDHPHDPLVLEKPLQQLEFLRRYRRIAESEIGPAPTPEHGLLMAEGAEAELAMIGAGAALADAAEGQRRDCQVQHCLVDRHAARARLRDHAVGRRPVLGEQIEGERLGKPVDARNGRADAGNRDHWEDRAENLLLHGRRIYGNVPQDGRRDVSFGAIGLPSPLESDRAKPASLTLNLGPADESFTVYDHPRPLLFENQKALPTWPPGRMAPRSLTETLNTRD